MNVIPAIDLQNGRCVRLLRGDFDAVTHYSNDPVAVARKFAAMQTGYVHIVDLDGAKEGAQRNRDVVLEIARCAPLSIQLGGGIRDAEALQAWFDAGVMRCVIGSLAVTRPQQVCEWLAEFGGDRIVLALDVRFTSDGTPMLTTHGWTRQSRRSLFDSLADFSEHGIRHVLCTDVNRDGALTGPNLELYASILERFPKLQLQASGGVRNAADLQALCKLGVPAAITGRALLEGSISADEVATFQRSA